MLTLCGPDGRLIGFDQDGDALASAGERLARFGDRVTYRKGNFSTLGSALRELGVGKVRGILLDLGVSSHHLDDAGRGFSFQADSPIDMRMDRDQRLDGRSVVNTYAPESLAKMLWAYGEERDAKRIVRAIVRERERRPIATTAELAAVVESAVGGRFLKKTLARVFQAIRIEVNRELEHLAEALRQSVEVLETGGRIVVISYHSLEDRIVKDFFRDEARTAIPSGHALVADTPVEPRLRPLTKKPVEAAPEECERNPRSRSAKLRAAERI
jgi:16S rRNA (cytosine1402-N4)-methyltransferase